MDMLASWKSDIPLTPNQARELLLQEFPSLELHEFYAFNEGWDNTAYLVNNRWVFRFPRRKIAVDNLRNEIAILPQLQALPLQIPYPEYVCKGTASFPYPFYGYQFLLGETACRITLSDTQRCQIGQSLAFFLKSLHGISKDSLPKNLPGDRFDKAHVQKRKYRTINQLKTCVKQGYLDSIEPYYSFIEQLEQPNYPPRASLVHGDLYPRHLIIQESQLVGIIDWGDIHWGNPVVDLAILHLLLPQGTHAVFLESYGMVSSWEYAFSCLLAIFYGTILLNYAGDIGDHHLFSEAQYGMNQIYLSLC